MVRIDENQEVIAQIRMAIDNNAQLRALNGLVEEVELVSEAVPPIDKLGVY